MGSTETKPLLEILELQRIVEVRLLTCRGASASSNKIVGIANSTILDNKVMHVTLENALVRARMSWETGRLEKIEVILQEALGRSDHDSFLRYGTVYEHMMERIVPLVDRQLQLGHAPQSLLPTSLMTLLSCFSTRVECSALEILKSYGDESELALCPLYFGRMLSLPAVPLRFGPCAMEYAGHKGVVIHCAKSGIHLEDGQRLTSSDLKASLAKICLRSFRCMFCQHLFCHCWQLAEHLLACHHDAIQGTGTARCDVCSNVFGSSYKLLVHHLVAHLDNMRHIL